ncbi:MAG TPA: hypothetical protein VJQ79_12575 [Acidimicrobiia bacterium]|nr:hypothetical protein [Acidimicrobiia bacterium]
MRLKTGLVGLLVGLSTLVGGVALAASTDTLLVEGFDPDNKVLVFGVSEIDENGYDCTVEGTGYTYITDAAGLVTSLAKDSLAASLKLAGVATPYGQTNGVCDLTVVDVIGPAGQVNHGQVVSSFVHAIKEQLNEAGVKGGVGCLVRVLAQSEYGKGDQQQGPTVIDETVVVTTGEVDLNAHEVTCGGGPKSDESADGNNGNGNNGNGNNGNRGNGNRGNGNGNKP